MRHVLFMLGIEDRNLIHVHSIGKSGADYGLHGNISPFVDLKHPEIRQHRVVLGGVAPKATRVGRPDIVFNCISDADTNRKSLLLAAEAVRTLGVPVINHPLRVLETRRDETATKLAGIPSITMPVTVRITPRSHREILDALDSGPVRYPAIVRRAGTHGGVSMLLLHSAADRQQLERIACDGTDYYLTEFVDFRSEDGYCRKIRIVMVDGEPYVRHQIVARDWNVHAASREESDALLRDEEEFLARFNEETLPRWRAGLATIQERVGLDYYSIDGAALPDGSMLLFEANASGNALHRRVQNGHDFLSTHHAKLVDAVYNMLLRPRP